MCPTKKKKIHRREFENYLQANRSVDPIQVIHHPPNFRSSFYSNFHSIFISLMMKPIRTNAFVSVKYQAGLKWRFILNPSQLFLSLQKEASPESCGGTSSCQPTRSVMERHMTMSGPRQVSVIEDCLCTPQPPHCQRVVDNVVYFADTPFETVVDVGTCQGPCRSGTWSLFFSILSGHLHHIHTWYIYNS